MTAKGSNPTPAFKKLSAGCSHTFTNSNRNRNPSYSTRSVSPAVTAFELAGAWRNARLTVVPDAGHSALESGIRRALVAAVERFRVGR